MQSITHTKKTRLRKTTADARNQQNICLNKIKRKLVPGKTLEQIRKETIKQLREIGISFI